MSNSYTSHVESLHLLCQNKGDGNMTMAMQKLLWVEACVVPRQQREAMLRSALGSSSNKDERLNG